MFTRFLPSRNITSKRFAFSLHRQSRSHVSGTYINNPGLPFFASAAQFQGNDEPNLTATQSKLVYRLILKTIQYLRNPHNSNQPIEVIEDAVSRTIDSLGPSKFDTKKFTDITLSKLQRVYALTLIANEDYESAEEVLCQADAYQKGYMYGDDQYIERTSLLCDWAASAALLGNYEAAERHIRRGLYMGQRAYYKSTAVVTTLKLTLAEMHVLKNEVESGLGLLRECSSMIVKSRHRVKKEEFDFVNLRDMYNQELSFVLYCSLAKSCLLSGKIEEAELYLDIVAKRYLNTQSSSYLNTQYHALLAIKALKQYESTKTRKYLEEFKQHSHSFPQLKQSVHKEVVEIDGEKFDLYYPSGFFIGGFLDILSANALQDLNISLAGPQFSLDDLLK